MQSCFIVKLLRFCCLIAALSWLCLTALGQKPSNQVWGQSSARSSKWQAWPALGAGDLDQDDWQLVKGDWQTWRVVEGRLQAKLQPPPTIAAITPQAESWPVTGDYQLSFNYLPLDDSHKNLAILFDQHWSTKGHVYLDFLSFHFIDGQLHVEYFLKGFACRSAVIPYDLTVGQSYRVNIIYQQPDFSLVIDDQLVFSTIGDHDFWPAFTAGGRPLFYISRGSDPQSAAEFSQFDLKFTPSLVVPYVSQLDSAWADQVYGDQLVTGTSLRIADYGCALSDVVMLLNYYGYQAFPDVELIPAAIRGQAITPGSLNYWLQQVEDGYLAGSLLNWLAISRLTAILAKAKAEVDLPVLEFTWAEFDPQLIKEQLLANQPVIADLDDHFVLITGLVMTDSLISDYLVHDPLTGPSLLSNNQHSIVSLRLFTPSQTDLSYWLLLDTQAPQLQVRDEQDVVLTASASEQVLNFQQQTYYLSYWAKPSAGDYQCFSSQQQVTNLNQTQLLVYWADGQVQIFRPLPSFWSLAFEKQQPAKLTAINQLASQDWLIYQQRLWQQLLDLQQLQLILANWQNVSRYQQLMAQFLSFYQL